MIEKVRTEGERIKVFSAYKLTDGEKDLIKSKIRDFDWTKADYYVDEDLLAGIIVQKGSKVINLSLKGTLANLKKIVYESD